MITHPINVHLDENISGIGNKYGVSCFQKRHGLGIKNELNTLAQLTITQYVK